MGASLSRFCFFLSLLALLPVRSFCLDPGGAQGPGASDPSPVWTVAAASFDTSRLSASERLAGDLVVRSLARTLFSVKVRRLHPSERDAYARSLAAKALESASKALAAKQAARDALLFAGNTEWKYRSLLEKADEEVLAARNEFDVSLREIPQVAAEKPVAAAKENGDEAFFDAPKSGEERSFCDKRSYDALLLGSVEPFYGRLFVYLRLYSPYLNASLYEDSTAFSPNDRDAALAELSLRLVAAVSGSSPATLAVSVVPEDAGVTVDGVLVGKGSVGPLERVPGDAVVAVDREGFESFERRIDLPVGERTNLSVALPPSITRRVEVDLVDSSGAERQGTVRLDGLYAGGSPVGLDIPGERSSFIQAESDGRRSASAVLSGGESGAVSLVLTETLPKDATPTEDARRSFYGAFGRFSLVMPLAFIVSGVAASYASAAVYENSSILSDQASRFETAGAILWSISGVFLVESVYRFVRYLRSSDSRSVKRAEVR